MQCLSVKPTQSSHEPFCSTSHRTVREATTAFSAVLSCCVSLNERPGEPSAAFRARLGKAAGPLLDVGCIKAGIAVGTAHHLWQTRSSSLRVSPARRLGGSGALRAENRGFEPWPQRLAYSTGSRAVRPTPPCSHQPTPPTRRSKVVLVDDALIHPTSQDEQHGRGAITVMNRAHPLSGTPSKPRDGLGNIIQMPVATSIDETQPQDRPVQPALAQSLPSGYAASGATASSSRPGREPSWP